MATIQGPQQVTLSDTEGYYIDPVQEESYSWLIEKGTILSGQNTPHISVLWTETGTGKVQVTTTKPGFPPIVDSITIIIDPDAG